MRKIFRYKGGNISFTETGKGKVIVLLHGYLENLDIWSDFAAALSSGYHVICIDLPGHGQSGIYGDTHSMEFMAEAVRELLETRGIKKACITGHSLGGYVTLAFLELFPESMSGYCLFHSHPFQDSPEAHEKREREIRIVRSGKKEIMYPDNVKMMFAEQNRSKFREALKRSTEIAGTISEDGIIAVLRGMMARPSRQYLMEEGKVPCLWILGSKDSYIPCETVQKKVNLPQNAEVAILSESGHIGFIEEPELSKHILTCFLERLG